MRQRFGLSGEPMTLAEIARTLGVTKERVRQVESRALKKLLKAADARGIKPEEE